MQKTLFKKYLRVTAAIILISFFLLGLVMLVFIKSYWQDEKQDLLRRNAESIAGIAAASATPCAGGQLYPAGYGTHAVLHECVLRKYGRRYLCDKPRRGMGPERLRQRRNGQPGAPLPAGRWTRPCWAHTAGREPSMASMTRHTMWWASRSGISNLDGDTLDHRGGVYRVQRPLVQRIPQRAVEKVCS